MKKSLFFSLLPLVTTSVLLLIIFTPVNLKAEVKKDEIIIGETVTIQSKILGEDRKILIHLPDGYKDSSARYPVLYTLDGNTYFMASIGIVKYHSDFDTTPEMIIVGIPNIDRTRDFTPTRTDYSPNSGGAEKFLKFIREELFPFIKKNYRTQSYRVFSGHSLGGLCVFYALLCHPDMFNGYIAVSPSLLYDDGLLLRKAKKIFLKPHDFKKSLYFSIESGKGKYVQSNLKMEQILKNHTLDNFIWKFKWMKDEGHVSLWARSFYRGFEFVSPWNLPEKVLTGGLDAIKKHMIELKLDISEEMLIHFGYKYWRKDNYKEAIKIFKFRTEKYPKSGEAYHQLGDVYRDSDQVDLAIEMWKIGIKIAEKNSNIHLKKLLLQHIKDAKKPQKRQ
jgi:predicted alpha/beta superfamily hydrolase